MRDRAPADLGVHTRLSRRFDAARRPPVDGATLCGVEIGCADCGCVVDRGTRTVSCGTASCCCMHLPERTHATIAGRIRTALNERDIDALWSLLAEDARWGDDTHPNRCRSRSDILRTFKRQLGEGVRGEAVETTSGDRGVLCRLHVTWPDPADRGRGQQFFHVYVISGDQIAEIRRYDDRESALAAISA